MGGRDVHGVVPAGGDEKNIVRLLHALQHTRKSTTTTTTATIRKTIAATASCACAVA